MKETVLSSILKAGLEAPSARNRQPWHFSVVQNDELVQEVHDEAAKKQKDSLRKTYRVCRYPCNFS